MHHDFWRERWEQGKLGFHEAEVNPLLRAHVARLEATGGQRRVLVPLAGKSHDLTFLAERGFDVTGVELVRTAADAYFQERGLTPTEEDFHGYPALAAGGVRMAIGDLFALALPESERFDACYDRAALIAVSPEDRERYVATCLGALKPGGQVLLVTLCMPGGAPVGPPFSVSEADVRALFARARVDTLETRDLTSVEARFRERGATSILEQCFLVTAPG